MTSTPRCGGRSCPRCTGKGRTLDGWPAERWLDIRRIDVLRPIMAARMDVCRCAPYTAFIAADKPVFHAEYSLTRSQFCPRAERLGLSSIRKRLSLRVWRRAC
jgi:hypothetical protein